MAKKRVATSLSELLSGRVKTYLEDTGMTVKEFAEKANISTATIYQIQRGVGRPSEMTVKRVEAAMREEVGPSPAELPKLDSAHQGLLEIILEEALTKKVLDRLIQYVLRETDEAGGGKMRTIAESLLLAHLARMEGKDLALELLRLHSLIRDK